MMVTSLHAAPTDLKVLASKKYFERPLMVSDLTEELCKKLHLDRSLVRAEGHKFYDTPITLQDDAGHLIAKRSRFRLKENYRVKKWGASFPQDHIWFFHPNGQEVNESISVFENCTAELPCRRPTQWLIDELHYANPDNPSHAIKLWFASGNYQLKEATQENGDISRQLELYKKQAIAGRTIDFRHRAYKLQRPQIQGAIAWNDYEGHDGVFGDISDVRMQLTSEDGCSEVKGYQFNLASTGGLYVEDSEFSINPRGSATNILARAWAMVVNSRLKNQTDLMISVAAPAANIISNAVFIDSSELNLTANVGINIKSSQVILDTSKVTISSKEPFATLQAIASDDSIGVSVVDSAIKVQAMDKASFLVGILIASSPFLSEVKVTSSAIDVQCDSGLSVGISALGSIAAIMDNATISVQTKDNDAIAFRYLSSVLFTAHPSKILAKGVLFQSDFLTPLDVLNKSDPLSLCSIDDLNWNTCQYK